MLWPCPRVKVKPRPGRIFPGRTSRWMTAARPVRCAPAGPPSGPCC